MTISFIYHLYSVSWGYRIYRQHLCSELRYLPQQCPRYDIEKYDGKAPIMLEVWGMWSSSLLALLPVSFWLRVEAPDRVLSMGQIKLFKIQTKCKQMTYAKLNR